MAAPGGFTTRGAGQRGRQGRGRCCVWQRQAVAREGQGGGAGGGLAGEAAQTREAHRRRAGAHHQATHGGFDDLARGGGGGTGFDGRRRHGEHPLAHLQLGAGQRVPVRAVVERTHQGHDLVRGAAQVDAGAAGRPVQAGVVTALAQVLLAALGAGAVQVVQQVAEAVDGGLVAACVQRQRGFAVGHVEQALLHDVAFVNAAFDHVPGDAVLLLLLQDGPHRCVQAGMARQRTVVEVDGAALGLVQHRLRNDRQVGDAEQPVEAQAVEAFGEVGTGLLHAQALAQGPGADVGLARDHGGNPVAGPQKLFRALDEQRFVTHQHTGKMAHEKLRRTVRERVRTWRRRRGALRPAGGSRRSAARGTPGLP